MSADLARALAQLERHGLLLLQDPALPSLAALNARGPVRGSWWGHPEGSRIFEVAGALDDHPDVATCKLVAGKVCFVHRRLFAALAAIGSAREPWQTKGLDGEASALLARVDREGRVRASGKPAKTLELRLLAASAQVHTDSGKHVTELASWARFAEDRGVAAISPAEGKRAIEDAVGALGGGRLPWR